MLMGGLKSRLNQSPRPVRSGDSFVEANPLGKASKNANSNIGEIQRHALQSPSPEPNNQKNGNGASDTEGIIAVSNPDFGNSGQRLTHWVSLKQRIFERVASNPPNFHCGI
jgi:hypothetical protein